MTKKYKEKSCLDCFHHDGQFNGNFFRRVMGHYTWINRDYTFCNYYGEYKFFYKPRNECPGYNFPVIYAGESVWE